MLRDVGNDDGLEISILTKKLASIGVSMTKFEWIKQAIFSAAAITAAIVAQPASACSDLPNICAAQAQHNQQMIDIAATAPQGQRESDYAPPPPDPMQVRMGVASGMIQMMQRQVDNAAKLSALRKDPRYQHYQDGGWDFFQDHSDAAPGEYCAAFYWKKGGMVRISGPGGEYDGGLLTFWGEDIPRPVDVEKIKVTLNQTGYKAQTVFAFNYALPGEAFGAIVLTVPSIDAALATMTDVMAFDLLIDGQSVAKVDWADGLAARDYLQKCVHERAKQ